VVGVCCCMRVLLLVYLPRQPALVLTHRGRAGGREGGGRKEGGKEGDESVNCEGVLPVVEAKCPSNTWHVQSFPPSWLLCVRQASACRLGGQRVLA